MSYSLFFAIVVSIGGILYGYHTSIVSGVLLFIGNDFQLTTFEEEVIVSTLLIGAVAGSFAGGVLADAWGRKKTLFFSLFLFLIGTFTLGDAVGFNMLLIGRFVTGIAIGIVSVGAPLYIAEIASHETRGAFVSLYQLGITLGILFAYAISYAYSASGEWKEMFLFALAPLALQCIGLFFLPETPSWLVSKNRRVEAEKVFQKIHPKKALEGHALSCEPESAPAKTGWRELFHPGIRVPFWVGIWICVFCQITGINAVIYYATRIFQLAGFESAQTATFATLLVGIVNVAATILALWLVDRLGRRPLLIVGLIGMAASLFLLGYSFFSASSHVGIVAIGSLMSYVIFFAISLGPISWIILSEIYPLGIRGRAIGVAILVNWVCNYAVSISFLSLLQGFGAAGTFSLYGAICLLGLWFVIRKVPETKGKTFEEIQNFWKK